jgi:hypothetical protein
VPRYEHELDSDVVRRRDLPIGMRLRRAAAVLLLDFPAILFPVSFAGQRLLSPELLARLQIEGMALHFFNNVLLLDLTFEAAKGIL